MEVAQTQSAGLQQSGLTKEQVSALVQDKTLRQLKPGTAEYKAAVEKKFSTQPTSESATDDSKTKAETKTESASTDDDSGKPNTETVDQERAGLSKKAQQSFDKLRERVSAAETERNTLKARIAELEASKTKPESKTPAKSEESNGFDKPKPKIDDFKGFDDFTEALADWKYAKNKFEDNIATQRKSSEEKTKSAFDKFGAAGSELEKELGIPAGDFKLAMTDEDFKLYDTSREALLETEHGPRIAYEIASDEDQKAAFAKMNPAQQLRLIGKLEAKFEAQPKSKETKTSVSSAKAPSAPLPKSSGPQATVGMKFVPGMSVREFEAQRRIAREARGKQ